MEVEGTHVGLRSQRLQIRRRFGFFRPPAGLRVLPGAFGGYAGLVALGATTGAVTRRFGSLRRIEKLHILALGSARGRTGATVHTCGAHGINKVPVGSRVAG